MRPPETPVVAFPGGRGDNAMVGGAYDGASRFDRDVALWHPPTLSADGDILPDKPIADGRVRDTLRNDAYVAHGQDIHKDNIVGSLFLLNARPATKLIPGADDVWEQEYQEEVETKFTLWGESPSNWVDAARVNTFTGLVRMAVGVHVAAGEVLASVEWMRDGRPFSTAIQMLDLDRLSNPRAGALGYSGAGQAVNVFQLEMQGLLRGGIERDAYGAPQAYWVQTRHPSDFVPIIPLSQWKRVPRTKPWGRLQMIHIFEQMRPDQTRGISSMVSALKELRITKKFRDVVLQNAVLNATYAATIESDLPSDQVFAQLGAGETTPEAMQAAFEQYAASYMGTIDTFSGSARNLQIDGVKVPHLFPGTKLQLRPAGDGGPLGSEFEQSLLRYIAANLGVSYEQLSKDYSKTNYSSARAAMTETWKYMQSRKKMVADRFASATYRLWLEEAINGGQITTVSRKMAASLYDSGNKVQNLVFDAISACDWIGASRGQIDELKETQAAIQRILFGLSTWEDELGRLGKDWRKTFQQIKREQTDRDTLKILQNVGSDMANATTGAVRNKEPGQGATDVGQEAQ